MLSSEHNLLRNTTPIDDSALHIAKINNMFIELDLYTTKPLRVYYTIRIFDYLANDGLNFTKTHIHFKNAAVQKCYQYKLQYQDEYLLINTCNEFLNKLGLSI